MRYREGDSAQIPSPLDESMFTGGAVLGLLMGIGFVITGIKAKQSWLAIWGAGLAISSLVYLVFF